MYSAKPTTWGGRAILLGCVLLLASRFAAAQEEGVNAERAGASVERGKYLVHRVAMCVQCHTPRNAAGDLVSERLLQGARLPVEAPRRDLQWAYYAPSLAGLPGWSRDELVTLLVRGRRPDQQSPRPPMPPFRMSEEDARSIAEYLKTLSP